MAQYHLLRIPSSPSFVFTPKPRSVAPHPAHIRFARSSLLQIRCAMRSGEALINYVGIPPASGHEHLASEKEKDLRLDEMDDDFMMKLFSDWMVKFNRKYDSEEEFLRRFSIYKVRLADWYHHVKGERDEKFPCNSETCDLSVLEEDDLKPGSCWAFTATSVIESLHKLETGNSVQLSVQELIDCDELNHGCNGGSVVKAYSYAIKYGQVTADVHPYLGYEGPCRLKDANDPDELTRMKINWYYPLRMANEYTMMKLVLQQPVAVLLQSVTTTFKSYRGGIFKDPLGFVAGDERESHYVTLVGYGIERGEKFWIFKNSWGEDGFFRLVRGNKIMDQACQLYKNVSVPLY